MTVNGGDLSHYNSIPNTSGWSFVFNKCTQGNSYVDSTYNARQAMFKSEGLVWGGYHFMTTTEPASAQAAWFEDNAHIGSGDLLVLDFENDGTWSNVSNSTLSQLAISISGIWQHSYPNNRRILYCNLDTFNNIVVPFGILSHFDALWIAWPNATPPNIPWTFWQFTSTPVDLDTSSMFADETALKNWSNNVTTPQGLALTDQQAEAVRIAALYSLNNISDQNWPFTPTAVQAEVNQLAVAIRQIQSDVVAIKTAVANLTTIKVTGTISGTISS